MTIQIPAEMEADLSAEAEKSGVDPSGFVQQLLQRRLRATQSVPTLSDRETELLRQIDVGISQEKMERHVALIEKVRDESISEVELIEHRETTAELERLNVQRARALSELAQLRDVRLETLMEQLQITPPDVV